MFVLVGVATTSKGKLVAPPFALFGYPFEIVNRHIWLIDSESALIATYACFDAKSCFAVDT